MRLFHSGLFEALRGCVPPAQRSRFRVFDITVEGRLSFNASSRQCRHVVAFADAFQHGSNSICCLRAREPDIKNATVLRIQQKIGKGKHDVCFYGLHIEDVGRCARRDCGLCRGDELLTRSVNRSRPLSLLFIALIPARQQLRQQVICVRSRVPAEGCTHVDEQEHGRFTFLAKHFHIGRSRRAATFKSVSDTSRLATRFGKIFTSLERAAVPPEKIRSLNFRVVISRRTRFNNSRVHVAQARSQIERASGLRRGASIRSKSIQHGCCSFGLEGCANPVSHDIHGNRPHVFGVTPLGASKRMCLRCDAQTDARPRRCRRNQVLQVSRHNLQGCGWRTKSTMSSTFSSM